MSSNDALTHTGVPAIDVSVRWGLALSGGGVPGIAGHLGFIAGLEYVERRMRKPEEAAV